MYSTHTTTAVYFVNASTTLTAKLLWLLQPYKVNSIQYLPMTSRGTTIKMPPAPFTFLCHMQKYLARGYNILRLGFLMPHPQGYIRVTRLLYKKGPLVSLFATLEMPAWSVSLGNVSRV